MGYDIRPITARQPLSNKYMSNLTPQTKNSRSRHFWTTLIVVNILLREVVLTGANHILLTPIPDLNV